MYARFVCKKHEDYGFNGWVLTTKPYFDPALGMQVAHDFFEEFPNGEDQPHDEFMAFGACLHVRGDGGYFVFHPWHETVAHDFDEVFQHLDEDPTRYWLKDPPRTLPLREEWAETEIVSVGAKVRAMMASEYADSDASNILRYKSKIPLALDWMRIGYRRALRRYKGVDSSRMAYLFKELEHAADTARQYAEIGDELKVFCIPHKTRLETTLCTPHYEGGYY